MGCFGEGGIGRLGVPMSLSPVKDHVAGNVIEQLRRASSNGIAGFGHCGQRLIFNIDRFGGIAGAGHGLGDDQGDRLTDMAYLADCQRRPRRIVPCRHDWRAG